MAVYRYPPEVHEFVKEWAPKLRDRELAEACNEKLGTSFTASSMKAFRGNHGYKNGMKRYYTKEEYEKATGLKAVSDLNAKDKLALEISK